MKHSYKIDGDIINLKIDPDEYSVGQVVNLGQNFDDLAQTKDWYDEGFAIEKTESFFDIDKLRKATECALKEIISGIDASIDLTNFKMENYHQFVTDDMHLEVIQKTRRLFPRDISIDVDEILQRFSDYFERKLSFTNPVSRIEQWMIARLNRPKSNDFNTAHKDVYESYDKYQKIPQMINIWVPLIGVTGKNSLPVAPRSHLLPENKILRTKAGSTVNGVKYSVNSIKSWAGDSSLIRLPLKQNEILIFSSHLIHGLAFNTEEDITRISFEFRLYGKA